MGSVFRGTLYIHAAPCVLHHLQVMAPCAIGPTKTSRRRPPTTTSTTGCGAARPPQPSRWQAMACWHTWPWMMWPRVSVWLGGSVSNGTPLEGTAQHRSVVACFAYPDNSPPGQFPTSHVLVPMSRFNGLLWPWWGIVLGIVVLVGNCPRDSGPGGKLS